MWKGVTTIGGIAELAGEALEKLGFSKAYHVVGQYLVLSMDEELFKQWLTDIMEKADVRMSATHLDSAYNSVHVWCENNL